MFEVKGEFLETVNFTKKGGFMRKFLVTFFDGNRGVLLVWSPEKAQLEKSGVVTIKIAIQDMVFIK